MHRRGKVARIAGVACAPPAPVSVFRSRPGVMKKEQVQASVAFDPDEMNDLFGLTVVKTVRVPTDLCRQVEAKAKKQGSNFNEAVIGALRAYMGLPSEQATMFIQKIFNWVRQTYQQDDFPEDVTYQVFKHIQNTPDLIMEYQQITSRPEEKDAVNRKIGKMVKRALNAIVAGRSLPLSKGELIQTYALLRPSNRA